MIRDRSRLVRRALTGLLGSLALLTGCSTHNNAPATEVTPKETAYTVERGLRFSPDGWPQTLYADLYLPEQSTPRPVVLMVHGGGWERRSREDMDWIAEELASHGFAVLNIDYRFAPDFTFPAQLHDLQVARTWLNQAADRYRLDTSEVSGFGFSSGAHLVALLAVVASTDSDLNQPHGGAGTALEAVAVGGLPSDLTAFNSGRLLRQFLSGTQQDIPETYRKASPISHVSRQAPPFFLFHGTMDSLVPIRQAEAFRDTLAEHNVDTELFRMHLRGHITSFLTAGDAVDAAIRFLTRKRDR